VQGQSVKTGIAVASHGVSPKKESVWQASIATLGFHCGLYWKPMNTAFDPKETHHANTPHPFDYVDRCDVVYVGQLVQQAL
jgi:hypothetical protein